MKKIKELSVIFGIGGIVYSLIEVLFRGFTHWTMTLTGGITFVALYLTNLKMKTKSLFLRCLAGSGIITAIEFVVGCIVNLKFHLNVWDYSDQKCNVLGQICPLFSFLWFLLSGPACLLSFALKNKFKAISKK
ncbi:MAG: hypothetical protein PUB20_03030 [Clostridia bacterium]|nr:hypothetical protein [Clostridia bacterium]